MPRPEAPRFVRADEPTQFAVSSEVERIPTDAIYSRSAQLCRDNRLRFNLGMFHVKLCAADNRVAVRAFAFGVRRELSLAYEVVHQLALIRRHWG